MPYVVIDSFQIKELIELSKLINRFHAESMLEDFLSCQKEDIFVSISKVKGLWKNSKELWLLE